MKKIIILAFIILSVNSYAARPSAKLPFVKIALPKIQDASSYTVEVYDESNMKKPIFRKRNNGNQFSWNNPRPGKYKYRVKYEDKDGTESPYSGYAKLEVQ